MDNNKQIKTLVYFDIEATGLKNSGKPRITELSLVAVNLDSILGKDSFQIGYRNDASILELHDVITKLKTEDKLNQSSIDKLSPRVMNKMSLCFYPMTIIMPGVTQLTGLDNYNLSGQSVFDADTIKVMESFLSRLAAPVCLVAHNGDKYDYPLLMAELTKAGGTLDILCVDSYTGIKEIFQQREDRIKTKLEAEEVDAVSNLIDNGEFDIDFTISQNSGNGNSKRKVDGEDSNIDVFKKSRILETENETTPVRKSQGATPQKIQEKSKKGKNTQTMMGDFYKSKKRLEFGSTPPGQSFSLIALHTTLLGHPPDQSHGAEVDCLALMRVTAALGQEWTDWMKNNTKNLNTIKPMWTLK